MSKPCRAVLILVSVLLTLTAAGFAWLSISYPADTEALGCLVSQNGVSVERIREGWCFDGPGEDTALIFYPGARVEPEAYAPLMLLAAEGGVDVFLLKMPFNISLLDSDAADRIIGAWDYPRWIVAGHSLGGVTASRYAGAHPERVGGLVLLAAYPTEKLDEDLAFLSVYGDRDGVLNRERYERGRTSWPREAEELVIPGGNHAQFGSYGFQRGDGEAAITGQAQRELTAEAIRSWVARGNEEGQAQRR